MPLDPQVRQFLDRQAAMGVPASGTVSHIEQRAVARARVMLVDERKIPGPGGEIPVRIYTPAVMRPLPVVVFFHGGGWVTGDLDTCDFACRTLSEWARCLVVSVNYRHAPEYPFPAALDDAYAATAWVVEHAEELRADAGRVAVGGFSAGGNLAAAVALKAKAEGSPTVFYQWLAYPVTDANFERPSMLENETGYGLSQASMRWYWDQYIRNPADRTNPLAAPMQAKNLAGLPPAFVMTAEFDPLRDEGEAYAERLRVAGVRTKLKRYDGLIHGFLNNMGEFDAAKLAMLEACSELRAAFESAAPKA